MKGFIARLLITGLICMSFWSCSKKTEETNNCSQIQLVKITGFKSSYFVGDTISLRTNLIPPISLFIWSYGENPNSISGDPTVFIYPCSKSDEGWYYLSVSYPDCASHNDSVYITVINKPANAPCSPANNTVVFSALSNLNFSSTSFSVDPSFNCKLLSGDNAAFNIYFNPFWNSSEPEDGEYNIYNSLDFTGYDPYGVYINTLYQSILFEANPGKVYVSHVNGKLRLTFCSITLSGSNGGTAFTTAASGSITAP